MTRPAAVNSSRVPQLDILRAVAVLLVIAHHAHWFQPGWIGVDLFFVLSGFLVSGLLFRELRDTNSLAIGRFFVRRGFKIYPAFYSLVAVMVLASPRHNYLPEILFLQNYSSWSIGHTWSLAIEEHFYIVLPLLLVLLWKLKRTAWIVPLTAILIVICLSMRIAASPNTIAEFETHYRIDTLFVGVALRYLFDRQRDRFILTAANWPILTAGLVLIIPSFVLPRFHPFLLTVGLTTNALGFACILAWSISRPCPRSKLLETIGEYSYSIYLWHLIVIVLCRAVFGEGIVFAIVALLMSVSVGIAMSLVIEMPFLRLRDRLSQKAKDFAPPPASTVIEKA